MRLARSSKLAVLGTRSSNDCAPIRQTKHSYLLLIKAVNAHWLQAAALGGLRTQQTLCSLPLPLAGAWELLPLRGSRKLAHRLACLACTCPKRGCATSVVYGLRWGYAALVRHLHRSKRCVSISLLSDNLMPIGPAGIAQTVSPVITPSIALSEATIVRPYRTRGHGPLERGILGAKQSTKHQQTGSACTSLRRGL
jgi:hypothetical protein